MQSTTTATTPSAQKFIAAYGLFVLSLLALIIVALAWLTRNVDQTTAIAVIGAILTGNGLVTATQWQAAPGMLSDLQGIIGQLLAHIQALHQQQLTPTLAPISTTLETLSTTTTPATSQKQGGG